MMKYEVPDNSKSENGSPTIEMDEIASFAVQVLREAGERQLSGDLLSPYRAQGSMFIVNVNTDEELSKIIGQDPLFFNLKREIYQLTTRQTHEKQIKQLLKKGE